LKPAEPESRSNPSVEAAHEARLVARAAARDQDAFRELVAMHQDRAYALALRIVRSAADAEEVAQDAFVRAWNALPGFRAEARFGTWLHRIVVRRALDRAATLKRRSVREADPETTAEPASPDPRRDEETVLKRRLGRLMETLTEAQLAAVTLYYYEDRSVEEIADVLGIPTGTVKTHLSRGRAALRAAWLAEGRETE